MKNLLLIVAATASVPCFAQLGSPSEDNSINKLSVSRFAYPVSVTVDEVFALSGVDPDNPISRIPTSSGDLYVELRDDIAPITVANFQAYSASGEYDQSIFHRSVAGFVIQGGGFKLPFNGSSPPTAVVTQPAILNEYSISNLRGTLAMAKLGGDPNSATSQWFINMADNSANLNNQNGGFTAFAEVLGDGMSVADSLASQPLWNFTAQWGATFSEIPMQPAYGGTSFPVDSDAVFFNAPSTISHCKAVPNSSLTAYVKVAVSSSNTSVATASISGGKVLVDPASAGTTSLTLVGTDPYGNSATSTIQVDVTSSFSSLPSVKGDFNRDGSPDIVYRNPTTGQVTINYMRDNVFETGGTSTAVANNAWGLVGTGDFNKDGNEDMLYRNLTTGQAVIHYMQGRAFLAGGAVTALVSNSWSIDGVFDFNLDGYADILYRNTTSGQCVIHYLKGRSFVAGGALTATVSTSWDLSAVADFNQDNYPDVLYSNPTTGQAVIHYLNVRAFVAGGLVTLTAPASEDITGANDFDGDGYPDLVYRDTITGSSRIVYLQARQVVNQRKIRLVPGLSFDQHL